MKFAFFFFAFAVFCATGLLYLANRERRIATENLIAILNTAGIDGFANGARIRAQITSVWGGRVTNIAVFPDCVQVGATDGFREWRP